MVEATTSERSAGGVLWRPGARGGVEVCLISTRGGARWQLPKGHLGKNETEPEAACREVREETGCEGDIQEDLGEIVFWFFVGNGASRRRVRKTVRFFLLRYQRGDTRDHDAEVDDARWIPGDVAVTQLTFDSERRILERALERLRDGAGPKVEGSDSGA